MAPTKLPAGAERRRSQRVLLVVPVEVTWAGEDGLKVQEQATTEVVNQHGALLKMKTSLPIGTRIELHWRKARQTAKATLVGIAPPGRDGLARNAVELDVPAQTFWGIVIPE